MTKQQAYELLKQSEFDYLDFDGPDEDGKYFVFIGTEADKPFARFDDYDSANYFVHGVHEILNRVNSAKNLRSFFK